MSLLLMSKYLIYPLISESFMHNGTREASVSFIYPMKYLNELLLVYKSTLGIFFFLDSNLIMLIGLLFL